MRHLLRLLIVLAGFGFATAAVAQVPPKPDLLILVSLDGFRSDYLTRGKTPALAALAAEGVQAPMRPSYPSLTFPNHYTLVTGRRPDRNGIVDNTMDDPVLGHFTMEKSTDPRWWNEAEPLWVTADKQGLKTATMFWPGSDRTIRGHLPDYWLPYSKTFLADDRVDQALKWLDLPQGQRPNFVTLYFDLVDTEGHHHGPNSKELDDALVSTDASVGRLVAGLKARGLYDKTNLIVVADHGMADTSKDRLIYIDDVAGDPKTIHTVTLGTSSGLSVAKDAPKGTLGRILAAHDHMQCWKKADMPRRLHYGSNPRVPPVVCLAEVGWYITTHERLAAMKDVNLGSHGFDPAAPQMAALFIGEGPAFQHGKSMPAFDNVDIQPLMAQLLHIQAPKADGSARTFKGVLTAH